MLLWTYLLSTEDLASGSPSFSCSHLGGESASTEITFLTPYPSVSDFLCTHVLIWVRAGPSLLFTSSVSHATSHISSFQLSYFISLIGLFSCGFYPWLCSSDVSTNHCFHHFSVQLHSCDSSLSSLSAPCIQLRYFFHLSAKNNNFW